LFKTCPSPLAQSEPLDDEPETKNEVRTVDGFAGG